MDVDIRVNKLRIIHYNEQLFQYEIYLRSKSKLLIIQSHIKYKFLLYFIQLNYFNQLFLIFLFQKLYLDFKFSIFHFQRLKVNFIFKQYN